ncbi:MAG: response regulator [Microcoleaceae cyanobacterium]
MTLATIDDQAYEFFVQESLELLQILEKGLMTLSQDHDLAKLHSLMRAAHSIKGGAACVGLMEIQQIAHHLENGIRVLYAEDTVFDTELENLLLQAFDHLRSPLVEQIETGHCNAIQALKHSQPIFAQLEVKVNRPLEDAAELPEVPMETDMTLFLFEEEISVGLRRWGALLSNPKQSMQKIQEELKSQAEVFGTLGKMLSLSGWSAIADAALQALETNPQFYPEIGKLALADFLVGQEAVLAGDREQGGQPNELLLELAKTATTVKPDIYSTITQYRQQVEQQQANPTQPRENTLETKVLETKAFKTETLADKTQESASLLLPNSFNFERSELEPAEFELHPVEPLLPNAQQSPQLTTQPSIQATDLNQNLQENWQEDSQDLHLNSRQDLQEDFQENFQEDFHKGSHEGLAKNLEEDLQEVLQEDVQEDIEEDLWEFSQHTLQQVSTLNTQQLSQVETRVSSEILDGTLINSSSLVGQDSAANLQDNLQENLEKSSEENSEASHKTLPQDSVEDKSKSPNIVLAQSSPTAQLALGVRIDLSHLDLINDSVGELVTQDNSFFLQNQTAQTVVETLEKNRVKLRQYLARLQSQLGKNSSKNLEKTIHNSLEELDQIQESVYDLKVLNLQNRQVTKKRQQTLQKIQKSLAETRMVSVMAVLNRFPRMVRDLGIQNQKQVELELKGKETLLDKAVLEKLYDPLVHLIRNAFDHGIEPPEIRMQAGKPPVGKITIYTYQQGNYTYLEIQDDGQGINLDKIRHKAVEKQLVSSEDVRRLSKDQLYELLFYPDFSTQNQVSYLSGRGVGLEAVRHQIELLKGSISIQSEVGQGTKFILRLPWMLTIAKLLVFESQNSLFAIPLDTLAGVVSASLDELKGQDGQEKYDWYGQSIPLVHSILVDYQYSNPYNQTSIQTNPSQKDNSQNNGQKNNAQKKLTLLLISQGLDTVAIKIDRVIMEQNLMIKPFNKILKVPAYLYGCTTLGDGRLVPVIDSPELLNYWSQQDQLVSGKLDLVPPQVRQTSASLPTILIIDDSITTRHSLGLTLQKAGYQILQAQNGQEGLIQLQKHPQIQIVICDLEMPEMNGFEFLSHCRRQFSSEQLPVLILTSRNNERHRKLAHELGSNEYLTKPWIEPDLIETLNNYRVKDRKVSNGKVHH